MIKIGVREDKQWKELKEKDKCPTCGCSLSLPIGHPESCKCNVEPADGQPPKM